MNKLLTCQKREKREREREKRETRDFSGCLAIATVGQKAVVGQGLPNLKVLRNIYYIILKK